MSDKMKMELIKNGNDYGRYEKFPKKTQLEDINLRLLLSDLATIIKYCDLELLEGIKYLVDDLVPIRTPENILLNKMIESRKM